MRSHAVSIYWAGRGWKDLIWSQGKDWIDGIISNRFAKYCPVMKFHFLGRSTKVRDGRTFTVMHAQISLEIWLRARPLHTKGPVRVNYYTFNSCSACLFPIFFTVAYIFVKNKNLTAFYYSIICILTVHIVLLQRHSYAFTVFTSNWYSLHAHKCPNTDASSDPGGWTPPMQWD